MNPIEIYIKSPTLFMMDHWAKLLPNWKITPQTIVLVLLKSQFPLDREGKFIKLEKDRLLKHFLILGESFYVASERRGFLTEIISPKDGTPQYSPQGTLIFDLVAAVHYSLGFDFFRTVKGCKVLKHPVWQTAVYPGLFLSTATASDVKDILAEFA